MSLYLFETKILALQERLNSPKRLALQKQSLLGLQQQLTHQGIHLPLNASTGFNEFSYLNPELKATLFKDSRFASLLDKAHLHYTLDLKRNVAHITKRK